ncbi:MAG: hypothetical protein ABJL71_19020 [Cyclobacteriaceae bacterium]
MATKSATKKSYTYKPQFGVIVHCKDERHQEKVFDKLQKEGFKLKVVAV